MADKHATDDPVEEQSTESSEDTEGHLIMPNIAAARGLANSHARDAERRRVHVRDNENRPAEKRGR
ncbi:hypothetical protein BH23CHL9_BH23CHL9_09320 [soil metagenome]|jgi:hypothetical protein